MVVQLPIYNERDVVERLIEAASQLDYPRDRLTIQVLDDSTDDSAGYFNLTPASCRRRAASLSVAPSLSVPPGVAPSFAASMRTSGGAGVTSPR